MNWHPDPSILDRYRRRGLGPSDTASVDTHLLACTDCHRRLVELDRETPGDANAIWLEIVDAIDRPQLTLADRLLQLLGVPAATARLIAATPGLGISFGLAVLVSVGFAWIFADSSRDSTIVAFLTLAAVTPLAGVAVSFGPRVDPTYEIGAAAPLSGTRLLLLRSVAVTAAAIIVCLLGSVALADRGLLAAAWLLPSLALATTTLSLGTWLTPLTAAATVAAIWGGLVPAVGYLRHDPFAAFGPATQVAAAVILAVAAALLAIRAPRLDHREA